MTGDSAAPLSAAGDLVRRLLAGDRRALARTLSEVENQSEVGQEAFRLLYPHTGRARSIGITGPPGAGKSTLTGALARAYRARGDTVGIVAVDPSSPFSTGALLGDRIRMQELTSDPGVFLRSMATRGSVGGLAAEASDVVSVLDAAGKDVLLIETVGAGQDEVEVATIADTTAVLVTPGMGDEIQAIKAGILEIADVLVVNKGDLPGADIVVAQLQALTVGTLETGRHVPVVKVSAVTGEGLDQLLDALASRQQVERSDARGAELRQERARRRLVAAAHEELRRRLRSGDSMGFDELAGQVAARTLDPHAAAREVLRRLT
jgi:LAO/AO transport system kinase